jgi:hypothetical protein
MEKYEIGCKQADAIYSEVLQPIYSGNPLIEALPENRSIEVLLHDLRTDIPFNREIECQLPSQEREDCLQAIYQCFIPWSVHIEIAKNMSKAIRSGYVKRNTLDTSFNSELRQLASCVQNKDPNFSRYTGENANAPGFSVIGYSGMGKTSAVNHALSLFPQVLFHNEYHGQEFHHSQLVWMKLECPHDGSVKGLCGQFFSEFDRLMSDNTYQRFAASTRSTTDLMIPQMALLARRHSLGILVIDEIQNISAAKSGGTEKMLNFLGHLMNTIGVPIVLVGTQEAIDVLSSKLMLARRNTGQQGAVLMDHLLGNSMDWSLFMRGIWRYQWTNEFTDLTAELSETLNKESFGIIDVAVKLFVGAQNRAILRGEAGKSETITPEMIRQVANSNQFRMLRKQLDRLRNPQKRDMIDPDFALWDMLRSDCDIKPHLPSRNSIMNNERNDELQTEISIPKAKNDVDKSIIESVKQQIVSKDDAY